MDLQWGETAAEVLERRQAASAARIQRERQMLERRQREGQAGRNPAAGGRVGDRSLYVRPERRE